MDKDKKQETALHITADKREIKDFHKFRQSGTSFIRKTLSKMSLRFILLNGTRASPEARLVAKRHFA